MASSLTLLCLLAVAAAVSAKPIHYNFKLSPEQKELVKQAITEVCSVEFNCQPGEVETYMNSTRDASKNKKDVPEPTGCLPCFIKCFMDENEKIADDGTFVVPQFFKDTTAKQNIKRCYDAIPKNSNTCLNAFKASKCIHSEMRKTRLHQSLDDEISVN